MHGLVSSAAVEESTVRQVSMVCSVGSGRMAVMARLLAGGSVSQGLAGTLTVS